jgi:hypothetical protein
MRRFTNAASEFEIASNIGFRIRVLIRWRLDLELIVVDIERGRRELPVDRSEIVMKKPERMVGHVPEPI